MFGAANTYFANLLPYGFIISPYSAANLMSPVVVIGPPLKPVPVVMLVTVPVFGV